MILQMELLAAVMIVNLYYAKRGDDDYNKRKSVWITTIILSLFSGFKEGSYQDLSMYRNIFALCTGDEWREYVFTLRNGGLNWLFRIVGWLGGSYQVCIFIIAVFSAITLALIILRFSPSSYWSYLIYICMGFFLFTYSGLKQTIAMGFLCLALIAILDSKPFKFLFLVLVAGLFHRPAMIFIVAYIIAKKKIDKYYIIALILIFALVFLFRDNIVGLLSEAYYGEEDKYQKIEFIGGKFLVMSAILGLGLFLRPLHDDDREYVQIFNLMVGALLIQSFSIFGNVFTRLADYYYQFSVLYFPLILERGRHQAMRMKGRTNINFVSDNLYILIYIGITLFSVYYFYTIVRDDTSLEKFMFFWQAAE